MMQSTYNSIEMIDRFVSFDTTSRNSNLDLIHFIEGYLQEHDVPTKLVYNEEKTKANLLATIGPNIEGGIILSGHTDVVPVDGQQWNTNPFELTEREGKLYGRGTADMKSFCAIALAHVPEFLRSNLQRPVHLAFSYDEEVGCFGARRMSSTVSDYFRTPRAVIVGEPTSMSVVNAHKGIRVYRTHIHGLEAHSSETHHGVSAIFAAADLIHHLKQLAEELRSELHQDARFDPPYTTISVGTIDGGTAINIIPGSCTFDWEQRPLPGHDDSQILERFNQFSEEHVLPELRLISPTCSIKTTELVHVPTFEIEDGSDAETLALTLAKSNKTGTVSYTTEAGIFHATGVPTVVCGPGSMDQGHKPDEFITLEQVSACEQFMQRLTDVMSTSQ